MAPRGGGCWYFIMEWPGIIRSGLFLALYNRWLAGSWGDVLIRVKRCGNKEMLKRWEHFEQLLLRWLFYRHWLGLSRRGGGQVLDRETGESWPDQTLDTGFLSAVMSVGLNCVSRALILKFNPISHYTEWVLWTLPRQMRSKIFIEI